jgi:hypothetical protein
MLAARRSKSVLAVIVGLAVVAALAPSRPAHAQTRQKLAVLGIEPDDAATAKVAGWITDGLRARASKATNRFDLPASGKRDLAELKLTSDCLDEKVDCMAQIGKQLAVDHVIFGKLVRNKSGSYTLTLKYLDVGARKLDKNAYQEELPANEATEDGARRLASRAFTEVTGAQGAGSIEIEANVDTGTVSLDGTVRGAISGRAASISDLPEGSYQVTIEAPGMKPWTGTVEVHAGTPVLVEAQLQAEDGKGSAIAITPPGDENGGSADLGQARPGSGWRIAFWSSLAVTAVGATAFTITGMKVRSLEDDKIAAIDAAGSQFMAGPDEDACAKASTAHYGPVTSVCDDGKRYATMTNVFIGVTAVAAIAAGFFYYKGYIASRTAPADKRGARRKGGRATAKAGDIIITPELGPGHAGLGAVITF